MEKHHIIPVWFFVGLLLGVYGLLILANGLLDWSTPGTTVLAELRAPVWWGAILAVIGGLYVAIYWPRRT